MIVSFTFVWNSKCTVTVSICTVHQYGNTILYKGQHFSSLRARWFRLSSYRSPAPEIVSLEREVVGSEVFVHLRSDIVLTVAPVLPLPGCLEKKTCSNRSSRKLWVWLLWVFHINSFCNLFFQKLSDNDTLSSTTKIYLWIRDPTWLLKQLHCCLPPFKPSYPWNNEWGWCCIWWNKFVASSMGL